VAINAGPEFQFTEAVSFAIHCATQAEVDRLWAALTDGGEEEMCGWLKDRYGLSWQVIPDGLVELLSSPDAEKARRATQAMFTMKKLDLAKIKLAYDGG
jgi:predicted 3-demethylubiquinone-9 3-methyltransferase (glyoxalase superfamily)